MSYSEMNFLTTASFIFHRLMIGSGFVLQWSCVLASASVLAFSLFYFGSCLRVTAESYERAQRMDALKALYSSTDWAAVVESANHKRLKAERKLEMVCKKNRKACI